MARPSNEPRRKLVCCRHWTDSVTDSERRLWHYQVAHQLSHSRIPFSIDRYAELARIDEVTARHTLKILDDLGWLAATGQRRDLFVGRLTRKA